MGLHVNRGMTESGDFVVVDGGPEPITDIKILSKKENKQPEFEVVGDITWACRPIVEWCGGKFMGHLVRITAYAFDIIWLVWEEEEERRRLFSGKF